MLDLLDVPTSRRGWAILISIFSGVGALAAIAFGKFEPRSFAGAGVFVLAAALSIVAIRPRRAIGIPITVVSAFLPFAAIYVLVAPQIQ